MHKSVYIALCTTCLSACTVGPDYEQPQEYGDAEIKQELHLQKSYAVPVNWYEQLGDKHLNQLIEMGQRYNTDIDTAISRLKQARANLGITKVAFLPTVNARGGYSYQKNSKNIEYGFDTDYYTAGFDASWELDLWGKGRRQTEAAAANVKSSEYTLDNVRTAVAAEIASNYVNLMMNAEKLRIAQRNVVLQKDIYETVASKYKNGLADSIAYNQARYLLSSTEAQIPVLKSNIEMYYNAISVLVGVLPSLLPIDLETKSPLFARKYHHNAEMVYNLPADIIRRRPDVAAAEQELIAANAAIGEAVAGLYPDVSVTALWGYAAHGGHSLFNSKSESFSYEPLISLPLLDWNRLQNNVRLQKYIKEEAMANYKSTVLNAVAELKNAMIAYQNEIKSNRYQAQALNNMQDVVDSSAIRYRNGLLEFSELLTTEQNLLSAQSNYIESTGQIFQNLIAYYKATGGGYLR